MLTDLDMRVLTAMSKQLLLRKSEIASLVNLTDSDGVNVTIGRLSELGYVDKVESLGLCYVITQKGLRVIKENNGGL
jgi:predicted transcriptional regulator